MLGFVNAIPAAMKPSTPAPDASAPALPDALNARVLQRLLSALGEIRAAALQLEAAHAADIEAIEPAHRASARNLLHYLGVRRHDIRALQADLVGCGLSSLSNMESSTLASIDSVLANLARLTGSAAAPHPPGPVDLRTGALLAAGGGLVVAFGPHLPGLVLYGLGMGFATSTMTVVAQEDAPRHLRGTATSLTLLSRSLGQAASAPALGLLVGLDPKAATFAEMTGLEAGLQRAFVAIAGLATVAAAIMVLGYRPRPRPPSEPAPPAP